MMSIAKETAKFTTDDLIPGGGGGGDNNKASKGGSGGGEEDDELGKACQEIVEIATEKLVGNIS
jgi:hypothetical protein